MYVYGTELAMGVHGMYIYICIYIYRSIMVLFYLYVHVIGGKAFKRIMEVGCEVPSLITETFEI